VNFQPDQSERWAIPQDAARLLAVTFGLTIEDVRRDAHDVSISHGLNDDYLLSSIETRHQLNATIAVVYLRSLHAAVSHQESGGD
jgi:hypothetical protein